MECFRCGISGDKALLFDAISGKGIVRICKKCSFEEDLPLIRKPTEFQLKESERKQTIHEMLSTTSGVKKREEKKEELKETETTLKDIIDKKYQENLPIEKTSRDDLVDNFHWIIMRARRMKKLTQQQLAIEISEPEAAVKSAEEGILPEDSYKLILKLENFLGVKLFKKTPETKQETQDWVPKPGEPLFDKDTVKMLTIDDLKKMKEERESKIFEGEIIEDEEETL
jgi:ribosome-binding protein aMBF1 (putative translation factor)